MVRIKDIIGIFDIQAELNQIQVNTVLPEHSDGAAKVRSEDTKSYVLTDKQVYYSQVSSLTLKRRASHLDLYVDEAD